MGAAACSLLAGVTVVSVIVALFVILEWVISAGVRDAARKSGAGGFTARQILDRRYVGGEIENEEYDRVRQAIERS